MLWSVGRSALSGSCLVLFTEPLPSGRRAQPATYVPPEEISAKDDQTGEEASSNCAEAYRSGRKISSSRDRKENDQYQGQNYTYDEAEDRCHRPVESPGDPCPPTSDVPAHSVG